MTKYPFTINGKDFSHLVNKYGYTTDLQPVVSSYTDLEKRDHETVVRYRGILDVSINDATEQEVAEFRKALLERPLVVGYYSFQRGRPVQEKMSISSMPASFLLSDAGTNWVSSIPMTFIQL